MEVTDLEHMLSLSRRMVETHALQPLLEFAMNEALQLVGAERGYIVLLNEDGTLDFRVRQGTDAGKLDHSEDQVSMSILQKVLQTGKPQVIKNAMVDPNWNQSRSVTFLKLRSVLCVPLISVDVSIGAIYVENRSLGSRFSESEMATLTMFAGQASVSIANARLYNLLEQQVQERTHELRQEIERRQRIDDERRRAEEALRDAEQSLEDRATFLQRLIDTIPSPIFYKDIQGRYQGFNVALLTFLRKTRDEILNKSVYDISPKDLADIYYARDQEVFQHPDRVQVYESQVRYDDGTERQAIFNKAILQNRDGSPWGLVGVILDITERLQAEELLRQSELRLRLIMEHCQEGIILSNQQGQILMANPAACHMFDQSAEEMLTRTWADLVDEPDALIGAFDEDNPLANAGRRELTGFRQDRTTFPVELSVGTFSSRDGQERLGTIVLRDISERHRYQQMLIEEERLRTALTKETELSQLKTRMMVRIAHEFRTPLAIIQTSASTLNNYLDRLSREQRETKFRNIDAQIARLTELLEQIGIVLHERLVPESTQFHQTDLSNLCRQAAQDLEMQFAQPGKYVLDLPEAVMIQADAATLRNAVFNVLHNAAQFSAVNSPVSVALSVQAAGVELIVSDQGIGILPEEQDHIFETFFRGTNIGEVSGLGLGLTIAQACVELHQGTITVESVPKQGTTFRIWLPEVSSA